VASPGSRPVRPAIHRPGRPGRWSKALVAGLLALAPGSAAAQVDVVAALGGRWEGATDIRSPRYLPQRVFIMRNIRPVSTEGDVAKWAADGIYGLPGSPQQQGRVAVSITVVGGTRVFVEFLTPDSLHVQLRLLKPDVLEGTHRAGGGTTGTLRLTRAS